MKKQEREISGLLEHVNITVSDRDRTVKMLCDLFNWEVRWQGCSALGGYTAHVGTQNSYLAVYMHADHADYPGKANKAKEVLNHIGVVVDDLDAIEQKVIALGFEPFSHGDYEPGRRFYFFDYDNIEYEVVSYVTQPN